MKVDKRSFTQRAMSVWLLAQQRNRPVPYSVVIDAVLARMYGIGSKT